MKYKRPFTVTFVFSLFAVFLSIAIGSVGAEQNQAVAAQGCNGSANNVIQNHSFESNLNSWDFYSNAKASYSVDSDAHHCAKSVRVNIDQQGTNVQLYQAGISLQANTDYVLRFVAKSNTGHDVKVVLQKHTANYNNYGLNQVVNLTNNWQQFEVPFKTSGFSGSVSNGRLRFWLAPYDAAGDQYWFDQVEIVPAGDGGGAEPTSPPPPPPTATPNTPDPTAPPPPAPTATPDPGDGGGGGADCSVDAKNVINNPGFESGTGSWKFYTDGRGSFTANTNTVQQCAKAAQINIERPGGNVQLYQSDIRLQPNTRYRLSFAAMSNSSHNLSVSLQKHTSPYSNYGLRDEIFNLTDKWQTFQVEFTTQGFSSNVNNGRLRFWFAPFDAAGDKFYIDNVELIPLGGGSPPPNPTSTPKPPSPDPTNTPKPPTGGKNELVIYSWNGKVTEANRGFPWHQPPKENGNWVTPVNYAQGTLYMRAEIVSQPVPQKDMRLQFCFWQRKGSNNFGLESCLTTKNVPGYSGTVRCWSSPMGNLWKKGGRPIEWDRARYRVAVPIKNGAGKPVSNFNGWNWNGENPKHWYPLNMKVTVVVVAKGATFSGWDKYGGGC